MKNLIFLIIFSLISIINSQSLRCEYENHDDTLQCLLTADNPNGFNNFTIIQGELPENRTFSDVTHIRRFNGITSNVPSIICNQFPNLINAYFGSFGIERIDSINFIHCSNLISLSFYNNNLTSIPDNFLTNFQNLNLIHFHRNRISRLNARNFANLNNLHSIQLTDNPITLISSESFENLPNGGWFNIYNTNLTQIQSRAFINITAEGITIFNTGLVQLPTNTFINCDILRVDLSRNLITRVGRWFDNATRIRHLALDNNRISELTINALINLATLESLSISNNNLLTINSNAFPEVNFEFRSLIANGNEIDGIDRRILESWQNLEALNLSGNICIDENFLMFGNNRTENLARLGNCFENFENSWSCEIGDLDERVCRLEAENERIRGELDEIRDILNEMMKK